MLSPPVQISSKASVTYNSLLFSDQPFLSQLTANTPNFSLPSHPKMSTRSNPCPRDQRSTHSHLHPSLLSHAQLLPSSDSSSNSNSNSSSRNARTTQRDDSPSSERFHEPITSHECDSDSDSDSSTGNTARRIDRMGGLGRATEEMFINGPARRAGGAQVEMAGVGVPVYYPLLCYQRDWFTDAFFFFLV